MKRTTSRLVLHCLKTWLICESCMLAEYAIHGKKREIYHQLKVCANASFELASLLTKSPVSSQQILSCLISCKTVATACGEYRHIEEFSICERACENSCKMLAKRLPVSFLN